MIFKPEIYHLTIYQGADLRETLTFTDSNGAAVDLSGASFASMIKTDIRNITGYNLSVTVVDASAGVFSISMPCSATSLLAHDIESSAREVPYGVWDCEAVIGGDQSRLLMGNVVVSREVTR